MLFLVVGTPWKRPRSSRPCCPDCDDGWFGGISSTRTATLRMRLRNSCGSESSASSTTLTKCSRFILHPLNKGTLLFIFCLVWFLSKIRMAGAEAFWMDSAHIQWYAQTPWQTQAFPMLRREEL